MQCCCMTQVSVDVSSQTVRTIQLTPESIIHSIASPALSGREAVVTSPVRPSGSAIDQHKRAPAES